MHLQHLYYLGLLTATAAATPQQPKCCQISTWYYTNYLLDYCYNHKVKCQKFTHKLSMIGVCRTTLNEMQQQTKTKLPFRYDTQTDCWLLLLWHHTETVTYVFHIEYPDIIGIQNFSPHWERKSGNWHELITDAIKEYTFVCTFSDNGAWKVSNRFVDWLNELAEWMNDLLMVVLLMLIAGC